MRRPVFGAALSVGGSSRLPHFVGVRQLVKIRNGTLGVRGGLHDGAGVVLQDLN
jgi:hypothetical protein